MFGFFNTRGNTVVALNGARPAMRFPVLAEVRAYWEALRNDRPVPKRSEIDPRGIERALENTFLLERIAPGMARFRLAGMHLNDLMGMEVRGMPLTSFFTPAGREQLTLILETVFAGPGIVELSLLGERGIGKPVLEAKLLILPLRSDLGDITRALGCLESFGPIGREPRRFDIVSLKSTAIARASTHPAANAPPQPVRQQQGFADAATGYRPEAPQRAVGKPALRLVKSDE